MPDVPSHLSLATIGRELLGTASLDLVEALAFLSTIPESVTGRSSSMIQHARLAVDAVSGGDHRHEAVARFMIARVVVTLEEGQVYEVHGVPPSSA